MGGSSKDPWESTAALSVLSVLSVLERDAVLDWVRWLCLVVSFLFATSIRIKSMHSPMFSTMARKTRSNASSRREAPALQVVDAEGSLKSWAQGQSGLSQANEWAALYSPRMISRASLKSSKSRLVLISNRMLELLR